MLYIVFACCIATPRQIHLPARQSTSPQDPGADYFTLNQLRLLLFTVVPFLSLQSLTFRETSHFYFFEKLTFCLLFIYFAQLFLERGWCKNTEKKMDYWQSDNICLESGVKMVSFRLGQLVSDDVQMCSWAPTVKVISIVITLFDFSSISCLLLSTLLLILDRLQLRNALRGQERSERE